MFSKFKAYPYGALWDLKKFLLMFILFWVSFKWFDIPITNYFSHYQSLFHPIAKCIAVGFNGIFVLGVMLLITIIVFLIPSLQSYRKPVLSLFCLIILGQFFLAVTKVLIGRSRPELWLSQQIYTFHPFSVDREYLSFPSGHTINIMLIFAFLAVCFPKERILLFAIGFLISFFRVLSLQHFFSDWIVTAYISVCLIPLGYVIFNYLEKWSCSKNLCNMTLQYLGEHNEKNN